MTPREVEGILESVRLLYKVLEGVELAPLEDVHVLAFERQRTTDSPPVSTTRLSWCLHEEGRLDARDALKGLAKALEHARKDVDSALMRVQNLFTGPGADHTLRGTLLGDHKGNGAQRELNTLVRAQERRKARGEYTPRPDEEQPKIPKRGK